MKKLFLLLVLLSINCYSQKTIDSVFSKRLNTYRKISVTLPQSYNKNNKKVYPIIYLMDGDYLHDAFDGALSFGNYWDDLPELIIVGLYQNKKNQREKDCSIDELTGIPDKFGDAFFEFFGAELIPYIETKYKAAPFRIVAGHDLTAGFSDYYLYKDNPLFNAYINFSPEFPLKMEENLGRILEATKKKIFFYASTADGDIDDVKQGIHLLNENLKDSKNENLSFKMDEFKNANHYSLVLHSIPNALYHIFSSFQPISNAEYKEKIVKLPSGYVDYLKNKYDQAEKSIGYRNNGRYNDFRAIEAAITKNKAYGEFEQLAQLANKTFPKTMLGEYYLARLYESQGDIKRATKSYQNAFVQEPIGDLTKDIIVQKIRELKSTPQKPTTQEPVKEEPVKEDGKN